MNILPRLRLVLALSVALLASSASAAMLYETRFDFSPFVPGPFTNQDGWTGFGTPGTTIQDQTFLSFNQSVRYDAATSSSGQSGRLRPVHYTPGPMDDPVVVYEADALLTGTGTLSAWAFQFFGASGGGRGGFNVLENGTVQLVTPGSPLLPAGIIQRGQWQRWAVAANFDTQQFDVYIDGVLQAANQPFMASIATFGAGGFGLFNGVTTSEVAYFDNFSIRTTVPEPALAGPLLLAAGLTLLRRRCTHR